MRGRILALAAVGLALVTLIVVLRSSGTDPAGDRLAEVGPCRAEVWSRPRIVA